MNAPTFKVQATRTFWLFDDIVEEGAVIEVTQAMKQHLASHGSAFEVTKEVPAPAPAAPVAPVATAPAPTVDAVTPTKAPAKATKPAKAK